MQSKHFTIKTMTKKEVELMIDWAAAEGWNPGLNDAECYFAADPEGFLVGFLDDEPIVTISPLITTMHLALLAFTLLNLITEAKVTECKSGMPR